MYNKIKELKIFGLALTIAASLFAGKFFRRGDTVSYYVVLSTAVLLFALVLFNPLCLRPLHRTAAYILQFVMGILRSIVLISVFYLIITPLGLLLRLIGKDILNVRGESKDSYWVRKEYKPDKASYLKQF